MIGDPLNSAIGAGVIGAKHCRAAHNVAVFHCRQFGLCRSDPLHGRLAVDQRGVVNGPAAKRKIFIRQDHACARASGVECCRQACRSAADNENIAKRIGFLIGIGIGLVRRAAEASGAADGGFIEFFPKCGRPHEGLVVEAGDEHWRE
jgi:hypothetical protein